MHLSVSVELAPDGSSVDEEELLASYGRSHKEPADALHPFARYTMADIPAQDYMAWETQGPIADRAKERLATSDRGIVVLRTVLKREIERVQQGLDPLGVIRDPDHEMIDTKLMHSLLEYFGRERSAGRAPEPVSGGRRWR
jgi:5,5'-dehydrodivanillate O-demethylase